MLSRHKARSMAVLLGMGALMSGCGAGLEEAQRPSPDTAQEPGAVAQALTSTCTDSAASSPDGTYDQTLCPNHFVTEVRAVNNRPFTAFVEFLPASTVDTQSVCEGQAISGTAWGYNGTAWTQLGSISTTGVWHPGGCGGLFCEPSTCQVRFNIASASGYSKVRVAGSAAALGLFKGRVRTGVWTSTVPC
ncbi:hypothetical protein [Stigmatella erecta]|uniref:Uncharacterized protein n=1 Tax=Stigmatella erecta TaxID=83460 RepID=A0A1I0B6C9_9BACT|nr:hypothetical protein [Stigmatella erecta]SET01588.1 hypothetical protein SAMN05443639_101911 [Stigmatella erecta]